MTDFRAQHRAPSLDGRCCKCLLTSRLTGWSFVATAKLTLRCPRCMRARSHMCRKYLTLLSSTMMYTATFLLKPASSRSLKMSTSVNMSMTTAITCEQEDTGAAGQGSSGDGCLSGTLKLSHTRHPLRAPHSPCPHPQPWGRDWTLEQRDWRRSTFNVPAISVTRACRKQPGVLAGEAGEGKRGRLGVGKGLQPEVWHMWGPAPRAAFLVAVRAQHGGAPFGSLPGLHSRASAAPPSPSAGHPGAPR